MSQARVPEASQLAHRDTDRTVASLEVIPLPPSRLAAAAAVATRAFLDDPLYTYMVPDDAERERCLGGYMEAFFDFVHLYGEIQTAPGLSGVACWLSPWKAKPVLWQVVRTGFAVPRAVLRFSKDARARLGDLATYLNKAHGQAVRGRHWQLVVLAVDPPMQGRGVGTQLIQPGLRRADAEGLPCYLDTQNDRNVRFYERFGFELASEGEVPGHPVRIWAMMCQPRSR